MAFGRGSRAAAGSGAEEGSGKLASWFQRAAPTADEAQTPPAKRRRPRQPAPSSAAGQSQVAASEVPTEALAEVPTEAPMDASAEVPTEAPAKGRRPRRPKAAKTEEGGEVATDTAQAPKARRGSKPATDSAETPAKARRSCKEATVSAEVSAEVPARVRRGRKATEPQGPPVAAEPPQPSPPPADAAAPPPKPALALLQSSAQAPPAKAGKAWGRGRGKASGPASASYPAQGEDIRERVKQLPQATPAEKIRITSMCMGLRLHFDERHRKSSVDSYVATFLMLFKRDGRSFATMATTEYYQLIKASYSNKKHHGLESAAVSHFGRFYAARAAECGGEFKTNPKWGALLYNPSALTLPLVLKPRAVPTGALTRTGGSSAAGGGKGGEDAEMVELSQRVPIVDPISLCRIEIPVRGKNCTHLQVFDKEPYIEFNKMMEKSRCRLSRLWNCPFCTNPVKEQDLVIIDAYVKVLAEAKSLPAITHVDSRPDGTLALPADAGDASNENDERSSSEEEGSATAAEPTANQGSGQQLDDKMERDQRPVEDISVDQVKADGPLEQPADQETIVDAPPQAEPATPPEVPHAQLQAPASPRSSSKQRRVKKVSGSSPAPGGRQPGLGQSAAQGGSLAMFFSRDRSSSKLPLPVQSGSSGAKADVEEAPEAPPAETAAGESPEEEAGEAAAPTVSPKAPEAPPAETASSESPATEQAGSTAAPASHQALPAETASGEGSAAEQAGSTATPATPQEIGTAAPAVTPAKSLAGGASLKDAVPDTKALPVDMDSFQRALEGLGLLAFGRPRGGVTA